MQRPPKILPQNNTRSLFFHNNNPFVTPRQPPHPPSPPASATTRPKRDEPQWLTASPRIVDRSSAHVLRASPCAPHTYEPPYTVSKQMPLPRRMHAAPTRYPAASPRHHVHQRARTCAHRVVLMVTSACVQLRAARAPRPLGARGDGQVRGGRQGSCSCAGAWVSRRRPCGDCTWHVHPPVRCRQRAQSRLRVVHGSAQTRPPLSPNAPHVPQLHGATNNARYGQTDTQHDVASERDAIRAGAMWTWGTRSTGRCGWTQARRW